MGSCGASGTAASAFHACRCVLASLLPERLQLRSLPLLHIGCPPQLRSPVILFLWFLLQDPETAHPLQWCCVALYDDESDDDDDEPADNSVSEDVEGKPHVSLTLSAPLEQPQSHLGSSLP